MTSPVADKERCEHPSVRAQWDWLGPEAQSVLTEFQTTCEECGARVSVKKKL